MGEHRMGEHRTGKHRRPPRRGLTALRLLLATVACAAATVALGTPSGGSPPVPPAAHDTGAALSVAPAADTAAADPVRVRVPSIGVDSTLARLGLDAAGALEPPADFDQAGWYTGSPAPGEVGPAVLVGHVDSRHGPAVFFRLRDLGPGDEVLVDRADGTTARFAVTQVGRFAKAAFPTAEVYGPTPDAQLRLITCAGAFDRGRRSYVDNIVVYARLVG
jgi:hypothetical protein